MANEVYQRVTDRIVEALERGVVPWQKPWAGAQRWPANLTSGKKYRGINPFLLGVSSWAKGYESAYWLTYKQARERGGHVRKGEKATAVVFWKQWSVEDRDPETGETFRRPVPVLRVYSVFNAEQCDELEYPKPDLARIDFDPIAECEAVVSGMSDGPTIEHAGHAASYSAELDRVRMPKPDRFASAEAYYATFFHELTHSTGHADRLSRPGIVKTTVFGSPAYAREELIAEMGGAFLCGHCGIETTVDSSAAYIDGWLRCLKSDPKLVVQAAGSAQKAADHILGVSWEGGDE